MIKRNLPPQAYTRDVFANAYEWLQGQSKSIQELATTPDDLVALYLQARRHGHLSNSNPGNKSFKNDLKNLAEGLRQFDDSQAVPSASAVTEKVTETTKHSVTFTNPSNQQGSVVYGPQHNEAYTPQPASVVHNPPPAAPPVEDTFVEPPPPEASIQAQQAPQQSKNTIEDNAFDPPPQQPLNESWLNEAAESSQPIVKKTAARAQDFTEDSYSEPQKPASPLSQLDKKSQKIIRQAKKQLNLSRDDEALRMLLVLGKEKLREILPE